MSKSSDKTLKHIMTTLGGIFLAISPIVIHSNPILAAIFSGVGGLLGGGALINIPNNGNKN